MTKDDILKAAKCCKNNSCPECPMIDDMNCHTVFVDYFLDHIKNEPAPAATGTSSEVSLSDTKKILAHLDDSTLLDICQEALRNIADRVAEVNGGDDYIQGYANAVTDVVDRLKGADSK